MTNNHHQSEMWDQVYSNFQALVAERVFHKRIAASLMVLLAGFSGLAQVVDVMEGCAPLTVNFDGQGSIFDWDSDNGSFANDTESPTFIYTSPGTYNPVARHATTGAIIATFTVEVFAKPSLTINADVVDGCVPLAVNFDYLLSPTTIPFTTANWVFGDGSATSSASTTATHSYSRAGDFNVALQLESSLPGCEITASVPSLITTYDAPVVAFEYSPEFSCTAPTLVNFTNLTTDASSLTYRWDFGDGTTDTDESPSHTYTAEGTYAVQLTATNAAGCSASETQFYTISRPSAVIDVPDTLCLDLSHTFSELTGGNATWDFTGASGAFVLNDDGAFEPITTTGEESVEVYFRQAGVQNVELRLNSSCGNEVVTKSIFVQELAIDPFLDKEYSCSNPVEVIFDVNTNAKDAAYLWLFSDGSDTTVQSHTRTYFDAADTVEFGINEQNLDTTYLVVTQPATATRGVCYDTAFIDFEHYPLNVKVEPGSGFNNFCEGATLTFTDSINVTTSIDPLTGAPYDFVSSWRWQIYDEANNQVAVQNGTGPAITELSHNFTTSGNYSIYLEAATTTGCTDTSYALEVLIGEPLTGGVDFDFETFDLAGIPDTDFCVGDEVIYSVTTTDPRIDAFHFYADNHRVFHQPTDTTVTWLLGSELGVHDVTLEVELDGCISSHTKTNYLTVSGAVSEITYSSNCDYAYEFQSTSESFPGATPSLLWEFRDDNSTATSTPVSHDYTAAGSGDYWVVLTADDAGSGCPADVDSVLVTPRLAIADIVVRNTVICGGNEIVVDASGSVDNRACRGLTFRFPTFEAFQRPITTFDTDTVAVTIPDYDELEVPSHFFQVIATDDNGCKDTINSAPINTSFIQVGADLSDTTIACKGIELTFSDTTKSSSTVFTNWEWRIWSGDLSLVDTIKGDGTVDTISYTFLEEPVNVDSFYVALEVTGVDGCVGGVGDTLFALPYTYLNSRIISASNNDELCIGDVAAFRGRDNQNQELNFSWDFGNSETDTTLTSSEVTQTTYTVPGDYTVSMYYFQPATGCIDTLTTTVDVESAPDVGFETNVDNLAAICAGEIIQFTDTSKETFGSIDRLVWDLDNGETGDTSPYSTIFEKGSYDVTLEASTENGCARSIMKNLFIVGPEGKINVDDAVICPGDTVSFRMENPIDVDSVVWFFGDGLIDTTNLNQVDHPYLVANVSASNSVTSTLLLYSSNGCERAEDTVITFFQVDAAFETLNNDGVTDSLFCIDETIQLTDASLNANNYAWNFGDGSSTSVDSPTHLFSTPGSYTISQAVENVAEGCRDTVTSLITVVGPEELNVQLSHDTLCLGETFLASLTQPNDSSSYRWMPSGETGSLTSLTPQSTFTLSLEATNFAGCVSSLDSLVTVIQPYAFNDWDTTIQEGKSATLPVVLLDSTYFFELTPPEGLSCVDCPFPVVSPSEDTFYNLRIRDRFGCFDDDYRLTVFVVPPSFISMPQSFSPNGDGVNDVVYVQGWDLEGLVEFKVFNRWGELIFSTTSMDEGWDGTFNGRVQNTDVYVYKIKAIGIGGDVVQKEGYINLIK
ncbi:MAG: PKD domain-containing protein [Bacteroidota bacterium]